LLNAQEHNYDRQMTHVKWKQHTTDIQAGKKMIKQNIEYKTGVRFGE